MVNVQYYQVSPRVCTSIQRQTGGCLIAATIRELHCVFSQCCRTDGPSNINMRKSWTLATIQPGGVRTLKCIGNGSRYRFQLLFSIFISILEAQGLSRRARDNLPFLHETPGNVRSDVRHIILQRLQAAIVAMRHQHLGRIGAPSTPRQRVEAGQA